MTKMRDCEICDGFFSEKREHCPYCGARRVFIGGTGRVMHFPQILEYTDMQRATRIECRTSDLRISVERGFWRPISKQLFATCS
jgi:hypothetical protein